MIVADFRSISNYYQYSEKLDEAERCIKKAFNILNKRDNAEQYIINDYSITSNHDINNTFTLSTIKQRIIIDKSNLYQTLASIYQKQGKIDQAIESEKECGNLRKNLEDKELYALHLLTMAQYYWIKGDMSDAEAYCEYSIDASAWKYPQLVTTAQQLLSILKKEQNKSQESLYLAKKALSYSDKESNLYTRDHYLAHFNTAYHYYKNGDYVNAEKCLYHLLDSLRTKIITEMTDMKSEQKQRLWNHYEHYFLMYRSIVEKSDRSAVLLSKLYDYILFSKSLLLDTEIKQGAKSISRLNVKWNDIQQHLTNDAIAVEFISTIEDNRDYSTYHALIIDKNSSSPRMITLYSESKLKEIEKTRDISDIVGELIWKPILAQYTTVKDIYFSPDGILHMLPIEYYSADGKNSMFENYNMYRLSSTKEIVREVESQHPRSAVLYGGLDYNQFIDNASGSNASEIPSVWRGIAERGGFDPLFNTVLETQEIKELLAGKNISTTLYNGGMGTEESFRNLSGHSHSIIHLATHGMYVNPDGIDTKKNENNFDFLESLASVNDPVKEDIALTHSFLVMAGGNRVISRIPVSDKSNDGILTSKEISQLDLRGLDLVVLSACESALGDINNGGVYGLQRGFKKGGANTIVMSLGKVDDEATRILMVDFYRNLMSGKTKRESLQEAQQYLRKVENGKYDDPRFWASFIMLDGLN